MPQAVTHFNFRWRNSVTLCLALVHSISVWAIPPSPAARDAVQKIRTLDHHLNGPFIVLDKGAARLWVFDQQANLVDSTPVLLGAAVGDDSVPGIGERPMSAILPHERTTPAGRFRMEPGRNLHGEDIFWVDYEAAVSLHRMRNSVQHERRPQRMASDTPTDNRISYGCINLPPTFFDQVIKPRFSSGRGWIFVLPETRPVETIFKKEATRLGGP